MLKSINKHIRDDRILFKELEHEYIIDNSNDKYISVTTLIKSFFPKFNADLIIDNWMNNPQKWIHNKYYGKTKEEIKEEWSSKGSQSASLGTLLHLSIENFYNQTSQTIDPSIEKEYQYFLDFQSNHVLSNLIPYRTEWYIFDEDYKIAGSIDMVFKDNDNKYHIYDWKRTIGIKKNNPFKNGFFPCHDLDDSNYNHYSLQLNLYKFILEKNYDITIESMNLVCLYPSNSSFIIEHVPNLQFKIKLMLDYFQSHLHEIISI